MKEERDCKIVQDLLPNYVENLTNEETNQYIIEHLSVCSKCKQIYENMQKEVDLKYAKRNEEEVRYLKKFNQNFKIIRNTLIIILLIFFIIVARKTYILISLSNKEQKLENQNNFYSKIESYSEGNMNIIETYNKDENFLTTFNKYSKDNDVIKMVSYKFGEEKIGLLNNGKEKILINDGIEMLKLNPISYLPNNFFESLFMAIFSNIDKIDFEGKKCYMLRVEDSEIIVEADTGLTIKKIDNHNNTIDYEYKFGIVQETDIVKPDTSGYTTKQ